MPQDQPETKSPFHAGELQAQERMGVRDKIGRVAGRRIRDHMPEQHREFYAALPFVLLGSVDNQGRPWASILAGRPGFMSTPDPRSLEIAATPLFGDPLKGTIKPGADIGLLGLQPETRRRNRLTGRVRAAGLERISIEVTQAFGNCPQYIQSRTVELRPEIDTPQAQRRTIQSDRFDDEVRALIERSDTLFIATAYLDEAGAAAQGADVSHRGGKPGFVRIEDDRTLVFPDFSGNLHFNTVGNILLNPKAGFLFIDFDSGDLVYMTGQAEIVWDGEDVEAFAGAERLIRFRAEKVIRVENSLPLRFRFGAYSPMLEPTGSWSFPYEQGLGKLTPAD
ncbi:MAG: putative pyridoxine 5'-phosphate oxidase superfamily flavin-nucleotide-binding protein [Alphaproteobacteria bacterium]|jgi:predicted pyridoxine 5'-phosphate oxidase superfamily flavin-nucleotide-binding protein